MKEEGVADRPVVLGYDRRFLSKEAMQWCGTVLASEGIKALLINKACPTPLVFLKPEEPSNQISTSIEPSVFLVNLYRFAYTDIYS